MFFEVIAYQACFTEFLKHLLFRSAKIVMKCCQYLFGFLAVVPLW